MVYQIQSGCCGRCSLALADQSSRTSNLSFFCLSPLWLQHEWLSCELHQPVLLLLLGCELCLLSPMGIFLPSTSSHHSCCCKHISQQLGAGCTCRCPGQVTPFSCHCGCNISTSNHYGCGPIGQAIHRRLLKMRRSNGCCNPMHPSTNRPLLTKTVEGFSQAKLEPIYSSVLGPP